MLFIIDAKSILGVLALGVNKDLTIGYHGEDENFENVLSELSVA